ncbi:hypothetical protein RZS08_52480, partial [Arthrospira platensis SPKY1]|nr:hypothetical protein [Arthrospira platensis SPKY1]
ETAVAIPGDGRHVAAAREVRGDDHPHDKADLRRMADGAARPGRPGVGAVEEAAPGGGEEALVVGEIGGEGVGKNGVAVAVSGHAPGRFGPGLAVIGRLAHAQASAAALEGE